MGSLGIYLKGQRELRSLSLEDVAQLTKIKTTFLSAIEEDRYDLLPSAVYAKGYVITYARCLGLDVKDILIRYQDVKGNVASSNPLGIKRVIPRHPVKSAKPSPIYVLPLVILIVLFVFGKSLERLSSFNEREGTQPAPSPSISSHRADREKIETQIPRKEVAQRESNSPKEETKGSVLAGSSLFEVLEASFGAGVEKEGGVLVLKGKRSEFTPKNQRAYFYTKIKAKQKGKIAHAWLHKGKEINRVEIEVKPPTWSVYSYITLRPESTGEWTTEVIEGDNVLETVSFRVTESDSSNLH